MGCGASGQGSVGPDNKDDTNNNKGNNEIKCDSPNGGFSVQKSQKQAKQQKDSNIKEGILNPKPHLGPVPKPVSFEIGINDSSGIDSIISKHPPKRLKRLEPLDHTPVLTPEMVEEKLLQAEEKRKKQLEKKVQVSRKSSRLHRDLIQAREFDKTQQQQQELEEKQRQADLKREARQRDLEEKRQLREEKARQIRERAKKMKQREDGLDFDLEKDETFNADDDDSWLGDDDREITREGQREDSAFSTTERIYSGHESPHKGYNQRSSAELRARMSAGTTDSFDYAFQRDPTINSNHAPGTRDDFFDT